MSQQAAWLSTLSIIVIALTGCGGDDVDSNAGADGGAAGTAGAGGGASIDGSTCGAPGARHATGVVDHAFGEAEGFAQGDFGQGVGEFPENVLGGPRGKGCCAGSQHVTSLGNGGWVVLEFDGNAIVDGPGVDFIVSENAFWPGGDESSPFAEPATVAVSEDAETWVEFECSATEPPFGACAGWRPVFANVDDGEIDPLDVDEAGGDAFDLADVGLETARFVRVTDRVDLAESIDGVFDLDAVTIVNALCP